MAKRTDPHITGILLAAGAGHRFDPTGRRLKLLEAAPSGPFAGTPIAVAALRGLRAALTDVVAVVRAADSPLQEQLHRQLAVEGARLVVCADAALGMGASIACGVRASSAAAGWLIALADMPAVAAGTIAAVRDALLRGQESCAPVFAGRRGHPVGFSQSCRTALLALDDDTGARQVLIAHRPLLIDVDDPGCLLDIDHL